MRIKRVSLTNFRNYATAEVTLAPERNIILGENAQGKTNFLEAIELIATARSERASRDVDLVKRHADHMQVEVQFETSGSDVTISFALREKPDTTPPKLGKIIKINGLSQSSTRSLRGKLVAVSFRSTDLNLLRGGPKFRRDFLDNILLTLKPTSSLLFSRYEKIVTQRNRLLKNFFEKGKLTATDYDELQVWDAQLASHGSKLVKARVELLAELLPIAEKHHSKISGQRETLTAEYIFKGAEPEEHFSNVFDTDSKDSRVLDTRKLLEVPESELESIIRTMLEERRAEEIARKQTLVGPHRDDLRFFLNDFATVEFGSQGQQRSLVLALKLSELERVEEFLGESPILLLDDVLAELDLNRQSMLMTAVNRQMQTIITTTDINGFRPEWLENALFLQVQAGQIRSQHNSEGFL